MDRFEQTRPNQTHQDLVAERLTALIEERETPFDFLLEVDPTCLNQRMAVQKGCFLAPCNTETSFEKKLAALSHVLPVSRFFRAQVIH